MCGGWKSDPPYILTFISCCQEESLRWWAEAADFCTLVSKWVRGPPVGFSPTQDGQLSVFQAWSPWWAVDRVLCPSLVLSGSLQVGAWIDTCRWWVEMLVSLCLFLIFSLFCLSSLYLSLGPHPYTLVLFILKTLVYVFKFCHWYLCDAVLSGQLLLQVSANIMDTVEHLNLEIQTSPHCLRVEHWVTYWDFQKQKEKTRAYVSPLPLQCN